MDALYTTKNMEKTALAAIKFSKSCPADKTPWQNYYISDQLERRRHAGDDIRDPVSEKSEWCADRRLHHPKRQHQKIAEVFTDFQQLRPSGVE